MYDATARFLATKLKEFCEDKKNCGNCVFGYHPTYIGPYGGERTVFHFNCRLSEDSPKEWIIPEEDRT